MTSLTPTTDSTVDEFRMVLDVASRVDVNVLIAGGPAVEEECIARLLHHRSRRACGPFVRVGCAGLSVEQLEWLLFRSSEGTAGSPSPLARAAGGTLFLESIDELTLQSQASLMRVLDEAVGPVDPASQRPALDGRIICSAGSLLYAAVLVGTFREDLYYRLNTMFVEVPALTPAEWASCSGTLMN
jgi:two-component system response regulator FlrC